MTTTTKKKKSSTKKKTAKKKTTRKGNTANKKKKTTSKKKTHHKKTSRRKRQTFIIDTNIILDDPTAPFSLPNADIILPQMVVRELDKKQDTKSVAYNARVFGRRLRSLLREQQTSQIKLNNGSIIILEDRDPKITQLLKKLGLDIHKPDSLIVASAWKLKKDNRREVTLLTNDTNMYITACSLGIHVDDYRSGDSNNNKKEDFYSGVKTITLESNVLINKLYKNDNISFSEEDFPGLHKNQILILKCGNQQSVLALFKGYNKPLKKISSKFEKIEFAGMKPLNKEQAFAFSLLDDKDISCVTLAGRAGTGKSIVALSYALEYLGNQDDKFKFDKILILKPIIPVGKDVGFLPGILEEKLEPWMKSFTDSLEVIFGGEQSYEKDGIKFKESPCQDYIARGMLEFQPLTFMRGRSLMNTLVILDEAQNTSASEMKTLITRIGEGSKVICLGDIDQIDAPWLDKNNNGLAYLISKGIDAEMLGHITFIKSQRSDLAEWASKNL